MQAEILYQSEGKAPNGEPFLTVKKARGYYEYAERPGMDSIAFILYDSNYDAYGLINESKPPMDERMQEEVRMTTAFGGSIDSDDSYIEICQTEVLEESGFEVPLENIHLVGETLVSTQMSQICYLYLVDITGINKTHKAEYESEATPEQNAKDPGEFFGNSVKWFDTAQVMDNNDWKSIFIMSKSVFLELVKV